MNLLIDAGNTRIKWALAEVGQIVHQGVVMHQDVAMLSTLRNMGQIEQAFGALVGSQALGQAITQYCPVPIRWMTTQQSGYGVHNHAGNLSDPLGVDRWLALIGLKAQVSSDVVLASLGTALTVEALCKTGDYLGGLIAPGMQTMANSLVASTALIRCDMGHWTPFPITTPDAMASGIQDALAGAITRFRERFAVHCDTFPIEVVLTGGDAQVIQPFIAPPCRLIDHLVLHGLLIVANQPS